MNLLSIEKLTCHYGPREVFHDVSFDVQRGEILMLLGANGSGKTTLLKSIVQQLAPTAGSIRLDGRDLRELRSHELARRITLMAQSERRDWPLTIEDAVLLGRAPHRGWVLPMTAEDRRIADDSLELVGLATLKDRPITQLSGGEWRRMILARALTQEADVLLLDEPTAGLDLRYQFDVLGLVQRLTRERKIACVLSIHDLNQASLYGDRVALLGDGRLLACGTVNDVLTTELVERAYGIPVEIVPHPVHRSPMIVPRPNLWETSGESR